MGRIPAVAIVCLMVAPATADAAIPPSLLGKSVVVSWSEMRQQRILGRPFFRPFTSFQTFSIYVSSLGRVSNRLGFSNRSGTGSTEQAAGETRPGQGATRVLSFDGQSLNVVAPFRSGGMRRIAVAFDAGFGSCKASVRYAKAAGHATSVALSPVIRRYIEILTLEPGGASCSVSG
jgi:hypothetical protein